MNSFMFNLKCIMILVMMASSASYAQVGEAVVTEVPAARISLDDKGFSIVPPSDWIVRRDLPRTSLFLQAVTKAEGDYPRNIAVVKFSGPKLINDVTADEFSNYLVRNFPSASPDIADYQLRNHQPVQMADGREGLLFYTDFKDHGHPMMQAHILVSSETNHYLVTFTDLAEHFENPAGGSEFLAEAWGSMTTIELNSPNPKPLKDVQNTAFYVGILVAIGAGIALWRHRVAGRLYRNYADMEPGEALELDPKTNALEDDSVVTNTHMEPLREGKISGKVVSFRPKKIAKKGKGKIQEKKEVDNFASELAVGIDEDERDKEKELPRDQWKVS